MFKKSLHYSKSNHWIILNRLSLSIVLGCGKECRSLNRKSARKSVGRLYSSFGRNHRTMILMMTEEATDWADSEGGGVDDDP